jgi:hypothetical protein
MVRYINLAIVAHVRFIKVQVFVTNTTVRVLSPGDGNSQPVTCRIVFLILTMENV